MSLIKVTELSCGYEREPVISGLTFKVDRGDYLCIVGENGSGKTTLMKTLLGLIPPLAGTIETGDGLTRTGIGYLPQRTAVQQDFPASCAEIVRSGFQGRKKPFSFLTKEEKQQADAVMERLGIRNLAGKCFRELSGGQMQRVLLARALCATETLLLLDEPVAGLDPDAAKEMYAAVSSLHKEGIAVIMITHDIDAALKYATHILHVGETVFFDTKSCYATHPGKPEPAAHKEVRS